MASIEEQIETYYKGLLQTLGVRYYGKTEQINSKISAALANSVSKGGGSGMNYPDIKLLLENATRRDIPVMIEVKGTRGKLEKLDKNGEIVGVTPWPSDGKVGKDGQPTHLKGDPNYNIVQSFAVNGAMHYGSAVLDGYYDEVIIVGVNGCELVDGQVVNPECKAYYVSKKNNRIPKLISEITGEDWSLFAHVDALFERLDQLNLSEAELEALTNKTEATLEEKIKSIHQSLYDDVQLKTALTTNEKLYLFCGLIMAGLKTSGVRTLEVTDLHSNDSVHNNDGTILIHNIESFLYAKNASVEKVQMISDLLSGVFSKSVLWKPKNGESLLKILFHQVKVYIIPLLESNLHLDFTGRILNSLNDWVSIDNDAANDVVLTPRYVTQFMAKCARTNKVSILLRKLLIR